MIAQANVVASKVSAAFHEGGKNFPATTESNKPTTPATETAVTPNFPDLMATPITMARGMVHAMVNNPQGECARAFTTTRPSTARRIVMMASKLNIAIMPTTGLISSLSIWPNDFPSRRIEAKSTMASCTPPPKAAPMRIHSVPGK